MKKSRLIVLVLALALLVGAAIGITASAEENTPELMSYNVQYGSYFYMQAAVDPASVGGEGKTVKVNLYASAEAAEPAASATAEYVTENIPADFGGAAYIAAVPYGISFTDMAKTVYLEAECDGVKGEKVAYSIVEYLLQRLYKDGEVDEAGDQRDLYLNTLAFGKSVDTLDAGKADKVADYRYVAVTGGTANGKAGVMVKQGATVTLAATGAVGEWTVTTYNAENQATITKLSVEDGAAGIVVNNNMVISGEALTPKAGIYYDLLGGYDYTEFDTVKAYNNSRYIFGAAHKTYINSNTEGCSSHVFMQYDVEVSTQGNRLYMNLVADPTDATNKVLRYHAYAENAESFAANINYSGMENLEEGNTIVFETDFYMPEVPATTVSALDSDTAPNVVQFRFATSAEATDNVSSANAAVGDREGWKLSSVGAILASIQQIKNGDGTYSYYVTAFRDLAAQRNNPAYVTNMEAATITPGTWNTLTAEFAADGALKVYVNGVLCSVCNEFVGAGLDITSWDTVAIYNRGVACSGGFGLYLDNTFLGYVNK